MTLPILLNLLGSGSLEVNVSNLNGLNFYGETTVSDLCDQNLTMFLKHGFLEVGAFYNVSKGQEDYDGNDISRMNPILSTSGVGFNDFTIYEGVKPDWIWETGVTLKYTGGTEPLVPSGIYVDDTFYPTGTSVMGTGYYIDFSRGRIVFDNPLSSGSTVQCDHSLRWVHVYPQNSEVYRRIVYSWFAALDGSGTYAREIEAFLPAIFIGKRGYESFGGYELGSRAKWARFQLEFDVITSNHWEMDKLSDILYMLEDKTIQLFDPETAPKPLLSNGSLGSGIIYPNLLTQFPKGKVAKFSQDAKVNKISHTLPIYHQRVSIGLELDIYPT